MQESPKRPMVTPATWWAADAWLTLAQAAELTGRSLEEIQTILQVGGLELREEGGQVLIDKNSLYDFQETLAEILHWNEE